MGLEARVSGPVQVNPFHATAWTHMDTQERQKPGIHGDVKMDIAELNSPYEKFVFSSRM
jgi:hypothetical protein